MQRSPRVDPQHHGRVGSIEWMRFPRCASTAARNTFVLAVAAADIWRADLPVDGLHLLRQQRPHCRTCSPPGPKTRP